MRSAVLALTLTACTGPSQPPLANETCLVGWWHGPAVKCDLACPGPPECSAADCEEVDFLGIISGGSSLSGSIANTASGRRFSAAGPRVMGVWTLSNGVLTLNSGNEVTARCSDSRLDLGLVTYQRYSPEVGAALESARQSGAFDNVAY